MRLRTMLSATAVSAVILTGLANAPAQAHQPPDPAGAGTAVAWGDPANTNTTEAIAIPDDLASPVVDVATDNNATALVTADGHLTVLGSSTNALVNTAPTDVTDAVSVAIAFGNVGALLHADGTVTTWGTPGSPVLDVPEGLHAKAITLSSSTGYAVRTDGTLASWGADPSEAGGDPTPTNLTGLVDVSANNYQVMALKADGTVTVWGYSEFFPDLITVPDFGGKKVAQISTGANTNGVIFDDGSIQLWGSTVPTGQPDFSGKKVIELSVGAGNVGAITDDGVVHTWGPKASVNTLPDSLDGQPVSAIAVGETHAAAIIDVTAASTTKLAVNPASAAIGKARTVTATVTKSGGTATGTVTFRTGSITKTAILSGGKATWALPKLAVGNHPVTASYSGDASTDPSTATAVNVKVTKATSKVKAKAKKKAKKLKITITVKTAKGISAKGKVTIKLKGKTKKTVHAKVNARGKATVTVKKLKHGKYRATVKYAGNSSVKGSKTTKKFKA